MRRGPRSQVASLVAVSRPAFTALTTSTSNAPRGSNLPLEPRHQLCRSLQVRPLPWPDPAQFYTMKFAHSRRLPRPRYGRATIVVIRSHPRRHGYEARSTRCSTNVRINPFRSAPLILEHPARPQYTAHGSRRLAS